MIREIYNLRNGRVMSDWAFNLVDEKFSFVYSITTAINRQR